MTSRYQSQLAEAHAVKEELRRRNAERVVRAKAESQFMKEMGARHSDPSGVYVTQRHVSTPTRQRRGGGAPSTPRGTAARRDGYDFMGSNNDNMYAAAEEGGDAYFVDEYGNAHYVDGDAQQQQQQQQAYTAGGGGGGVRRGSTADSAAGAYGAAPQQRGASAADSSVVGVGQPLNRLEEIHGEVAADHDRRAASAAALSAARSTRSRSARAGYNNNNMINNMVVAEGERFVEFTSRVEGCLAFCVCDYQGGASVWTANTDGTLTIRNGTTLAAVVEIPRRADDVTPSVFYPTRDGYVWVGYTDGTVQIYDGNVFVLITEGQFHNDEVTAFVQMHDKRVVSGSVDGSIVRWEGEERSFEAMSRVVLSDASAAGAALATLGRGSDQLSAAEFSNGALLASPGGGAHHRRRPTNEGVQCLATQGFEVFVGCSLTGHLASIHAQEEVELGVFKAPGSEGSDCLCLAVADGYLFSGYASQRVFVWNIESRRCLHSVALHSVPVSITADYRNAPVSYETIANRLWVSLADATVQVWSTLADERFNADLAITAFTAAAPGAELLSLQTCTAWESMRAVSIGSNGVSKVWASLNAKGRRARLDTIDNLASVLKHDAVQLDRIGATVQLFRDRQERRVAHLAEMMLRARREAALRDFYLRWQSFAQRRGAERNQRETAVALCVLHPQQSLAFRYVSKWYRWMAARRKASNAKKYALTLKPVQQERVHLLFLHRLKQFHACMRAHKNMEIIMQMFARSSRENLLRATYLNWVEFLRRRHRNRRLAAVADALTVSTDLTFLRRYYAKWFQHHAQRIYLLRMGAQLMEAAGRMGTTNLMRAAYRRMYLYAKQRRALRQIRFTAEQTWQQRLLREYYLKWAGYLSTVGEGRAMRHLAAKQRELEQLRAEHSGLEAIVAKRVALEKLRAELRAADDEIAASQGAYDEATEAIRRLQEAIEAKRLSRQAEEGTTQEQLFRLMARLKAKALNFYSDVQLFNQIRERLKSGGQQIIVRHFLESHQSVKRVVVDVTKKPHLGVTEKWPLTPSIIERLPTHHLTPIHNAIKVMVLCFDIMSRDTRDGIQTDQEIVLNGDHLLSMLDVCVAHRKRMLRGASGSGGAGAGGAGAQRSSTPGRATTPARR